MSKVSKFLESELDKVNEYLVMAKTTLLVPTELCENNCETISNELDSEDIDIINFLVDELPKIESRINDAKEIICKFKDHAFNLSE